MSNIQKNAQTESSDSIMETLYMGSSGSNVGKLQQKLQEQDLYVGSIDGLFGQGVEMAVKEFQTLQGLAADGIAGLSTLAALGLIALERDPDPDA